MLREIVATLIILEGGIFMTACLMPGGEAYLFALMQRHPELIPVNRLGEFASAIGIARNIGSVFGALACIIGFAARRGQGWGRWSGVAISVVNLGTGLFTPLGIAGLFAFLREPEVKAAIEEAPPATGERPEPISHLMSMVVSMGLVVYFAQMMRQVGRMLELPINGSEHPSLVWIVTGVFVFGLIHEMGHYLVAHLTGFRFREIRIGPFILEERIGGTWGFRFSIPHMLAGSGYLLAIPKTAEGLRFNWILVSGAGPATSLLLALVGFLVILTLRFTGSAEEWWWAGYVTAVCSADFLANMIPLGLSDGATLLHTILRTHRGQGILAGLEAAMLSDIATRNAGLMDPLEVANTRKQALAQMEKSSDGPGLPLLNQQIEFAQAALRSGRTAEGMKALQEAGALLPKIEVVPDLVRFRYWAALFEVATAHRQFTTASEAREKAIEYHGLLRSDKMDWEEWVPVQIASAKMWMSDREYVTALACVREARAKCPERRWVTGHAAELLAVEAECELRLGRRETAESLIETALEVALDLAGAQKATAMELLADTATRLSLAGEYGFAEPIFATTVAAMRGSASPEMMDGYRKAWAIALYENGRLEDAAQVLTQVRSSGEHMGLDIQMLRANLLMAEDRASDALEILNPIFSQTEEQTPDQTERNRVHLARGRALRSWAFYRNGDTEAAMADARQACDELMPKESPDAAPALLTLAVAAAADNPPLAEAYLQESVRLITETTLLSPSTKASRLTELARSLVQIERREWAKFLLDHAAKLRPTASVVNAPHTAKMPA